MPALPFIQDTHLAVPDLAPDWTFLETHLEKGNQQYEKGLNEVISNYSAVLNADVTNQGNQVKKAEYLKQFQEGLDKLAGSNLALPKYQADAEKIMAPFWQDSFLLTDMSYTKHKKAEIAKGNAAQNSKDAATRDTYSGASVELMGLQLDELRTMDRDKVSSGNLDWDTYTADPNIKGVLGKATDNDDFSITHDIRDGKGSINRITNGPGSQSNYRVYANGIVDEKYDNYFKMLGKLEVARHVSNYRKQGIGKEEATMVLAEPEYKRTLQSLNSNITDYNDTIRDKSKLLADLKKTISSQGGKMDDNQKNSFDQLTMEIDSYTHTRDRQKETLDNLTTENGKRGFLIQPEASLAQKHRSDMINGWAWAQANNVSTSIEEDKPFWQGKKLDQEWAKLTADINHNQAMERIAQQTANTAAGHLTLAAAIAAAEHPESFGPNAGGKNAPGASFEGYNKAAITTEDKVATAEAERQKTQAAVYGSIYNPNGLVGNLYQTASAPADEATVNKFNDAVNGFSEYMSGVLSGNIQVEKDEKGKWRAKGAKPEVVGQFWEVSKFLENQTGKKITSVEEAHTAMMLYTAKHIEQTDGVGALTAPQAAKFRDMYRPIKANVSLLENDAYQKSQNIKKIIAGTPADSDIRKLVKGKGDNLEFITADDLAPYFPKTTVMRETYASQMARAKNEGIYVLPELRIKPREIVVTGKELAQEYLDGKMHHYKGVGITRPEAEYEASPSDPAQHAHLNIGSKFGYSEDIPGIKKGVQEKAMEGTAFYNKANNLYAGRYGYDVDIAKGGLGKRNRDRFKELSQVGNYSDMYAQTPNKAGSESLTGEQMGTVREILNDENVGNYIGTSAHYNLSGPKGKGAGEIHIKTDMPDNAPASYKALAGKTIFIEKDPNAAGTFVNEFPSAVDASLHKLNRGQSVSSDPAEDKINKANWTMKPYPSTGAPQYYQVIMTKTIFDSKDGKDHTYTDRVNVPAGDTDPNKLEDDVRGVVSYSGANYFTARDRFRNGIK